MRHTSTHYYVQVQEKGKSPAIIHHTVNKEKDEYYYKFIDRKKAQALADAEKKISPNFKFRVVKCSTTYDAKPWF